MTKFTQSAVLKALEEIVEELGEDYVYLKNRQGSCVYAVGQQPSCIVGRVIAKIDPDKFEEVREAEVQYGASFSASALNGHTTSKMTFPDLEASKDVLDLLSYAQDTQDSGHRYRDVLEGVYSRVGSE